jgi:hypothetical protein
MGSKAVYAHQREGLILGLDDDPRKVGVVVLGHDDSAGLVDVVPQHGGKPPTATADADRDLVVAILVGDAAERQSLRLRSSDFVRDQLDRGLELSAVLDAFVESLEEGRPVARSFSPRPCCASDPTFIANSRHTGRWQSWT